MTEAKKTQKTTILTGKQVLSEKIHLGKTEEKDSGRYNYLTTQVLYDNKPFLLKERGKMKIFSFNKKSFSVGLSIDETNKDYFETIEKKINELYDNVEIKLIKPINDYLKIYLKLFSRNGKIHTPFRILEGNKKRLVEPLDYVGIPFTGQVFFKIARIYDGNCVSLICEAKEVLIGEVFNQNSVFNEYSDVEDGNGKITQSFFIFF